YQKYVKSEGEDLNSIIHGIMQKKGKIHLAVTDTISEAELEECDGFIKNEKFSHLAKIIDKRIYDNYVLWKTNYIAFDILHGTGAFKSHYSSDEKMAFEKYMNDGLMHLTGDYDELLDIFLNIYANPVKNVLSL
ncbi:MAG: acyltransferase, partial [Bacteroidales bacterium]|nr:acyltransferase [Bacteroidales bacterium]